jgi:hypothetical protein
MSGQLYQFVFRGWLAEEALNKAGRVNRSASSNNEADFAAILSLDLLDNGLVANARCRMYGRGKIDLLQARVIGAV